jgi:acetoin utilization protein AcuB
MRHMPHVIAMMTPFPHAIDIDAPLADARALMHSRGIRHLPVMEGGRLRGLITDRDAKLALGPDLGSPPERELRVRDVYLDDAYTVEANAPLDEVAAHMAERHIGSAIVTRDGKLCGVFTATDACRALALVLRERFPPHTPGTSAA